MHACTRGDNISNLATYFFRGPKMQMYLLTFFLTVDAFVFRQFLCAEQ